MKLVLLILLVASPLVAETVYPYENGYALSKTVGDLTLKATLRDNDYDGTNVKLALTATIPTFGPSCYYIMWNLKNPNDYSQGDVAFFQVSSSTTSAITTSPMRDGYLKLVGTDKKLMVTSDTSEWVLSTYTDSESTVQGSKKVGNTLYFDVYRPFAITTGQSNYDTKIPRFNEGGIRAAIWMEANTCTTTDTTWTPTDSEVLYITDFKSLTIYNPSNLFNSNYITNKKLANSNMVGMTIALFAGLVALLN